MRYDIAIIGTGPAGLSAALTAKKRNKSFILIGSRHLSVKVEKAHLIQNYLGLPAVSGEELKKAFLAHLDAEQIAITENRVSQVFAMGDYYALQLGEDIVEATAIILATGVVTGKTFPGEDALLGRGVSYCATCDATLYRGKDTAVIGYSAKEEEEAAFLAEIAGSVVYYPMYKEEPALPENVKVLREKPVSFAKDGRKVVLTTDAGEAVYDGVFVLRDAISPGTLVPGLETEGAHVPVNRQMATNLPGCFAAGDLTGLPYQYAKAAGEGNVAALSAVSYIDQLKKA